MVQYHKFSKTKSSGSGGRRRMAADKRKANWGGFFARAKAGDKDEARPFRVRGGKSKASVHHAQHANVAVGGKVQRVKIVTVKESPDNRHFARENLLTLGAVIETELGKAKITSRPGQDGSVNAVLLQSKG
ncbi:30S ribosomal protein S8e [Candidatus Micrarchaeota archaeon]|nr:30S ribosomal protein S8e [Candidatus Micrarchaeota archaeon]